MRYLGNFPFKSPSPSAVPQGTKRFSSHTPLPLSPADFISIARMSKEDLIIRAANNPNPVTVTLTARLGHARLSRDVLPGSVAALASSRPQHWDEEERNISLGLAARAPACPQVLAGGQQADKGTGVAVPPCCKQSSGELSLGSYLGSGIGDSSPGQPSTQQRGSDAEAGLWHFTQGKSVPAQRWAVNSSALWELSLPLPPE